MPYSNAILVWYYIETLIDCRVWLKTAGKIEDRLAYQAFT
jgi:hypothetical protein